MFQGNVTSPASPAPVIPMCSFTGHGQKQVAGLSEHIISFFMSLLTCPWRFFGCASFKLCCLLFTTGILTKRVSCSHCVFIRLRVASKC